MATFIVSNTDDSGAGSLRQAIDLTNNTPGADTINFDSTVFGTTPQTITLTSGELVITDDLTINGTGANNLTVSGFNASRVFKISGYEIADNLISGSLGSFVTIDGLAIADGNTSGSGGGIYNGGRLSLTNSSVSGNVGMGDGGGGIFREFPA